MPVASFEAFGEEIQRLPTTRVRSIHAIWDVHCDEAEDGLVSAQALFDSVRDLGKGYMMRLARTSDGDWVYTVYGAEVVAMSGFDMSGRCISEFPDDVAVFFSTQYDRACVKNTPCYSLHVAKLAKHAQTWERLILPCRTGDHQEVVVYNAPRYHRTKVVGDMVETAPIGLMAVSCLHDGSSSVRDFVVIEANQAAASMLGIEKVDLVGTYLEAVFGDGWEELKAGISECDRAGTQTLMAPGFAPGFDFTISAGSDKGLSVVSIQKSTGQLFMVDAA
ncbi:MAG: PAS domain-containing protein [Pseudomonadota bacterium]